MELIIAEKANAAERISDILSGGEYSTRNLNGVTVYEWDSQACVGLSGHVVEVDFTEDYNDWGSVEPSELIDAELKKRPSRKNIVDAVKQLAREADRAVIATDYDSEGELIGKEAYELIEEEADVPIDRVRFSSLTPGEVRNAFEDRDELDFDLAAAGEARQIIDLIWGAALTRYLSLASKRLGDSYLSVGRVQSPTLKILVDREKEIEEFDPEPYWEIYADLLKEERVVESQYFYRDDGKEQERIWDGNVAESVFNTVESASDAWVESVDTRTRNDYPPPPFDTTQFIRAAGAIGFSASRAMSLAEDLYTQGFISYPRTDNTVYPDDIEPRGVLEMLAKHDEFSDASELLKDSLTPTSGDKETTDHPPIYPTALVYPDELGDDEWRVYELVARRFLATFADPAKWEHIKAVFDVAGESFKANGKRLLEPGYHAYYPYFNTSENRLPALEEGESLEVHEVELEEKETQPPNRIGQSKLVEKMEEKGIGTKCVTGDTRVVVGDDRERVRFDELFDWERVAMADGDADVAFSEKNNSVISLQHSRARLTERETSLVSRRELREDEYIIRVRIPNGSFSVTDNHPIYVFQDGGITIKPASNLETGDRLVSARPSNSFQAVDEVALGWEEFVEDCDKSTKLYGTGCNNDLVRIRNKSRESQHEFAERYGTYHDAISRFETGKRDLPLWLIRELGLEPIEIHGLNPETSFENPFPLKWTPELVRLIASTLGDGSVHLDESENSIDVRYHNTDTRLIQRFVRDVKKVFGVEPAVHEREKDVTRKKRYHVQLPSSVSRILVRILEKLEVQGAQYVPNDLQPVFVGALFDDEGHISVDGKAFISNKDHELLSVAGDMLSNYEVDSTLNTSQHKLYVRGRRDLERFLDTVPISADEKFYRGLSQLSDYNVTRRKGHILDLIRNAEMTSDELAKSLGVSRSTVNLYIRELKQDGYIETRIEGSNRSHDGNRSFFYTADNVTDSIYNTVLGYPSTSKVIAVEERDYNGYVYDLTVDEQAPNFAVEGGAVVHNSTRHNTIQKLYDRGYVEQSPPRPTAIARAVIQAMEEYAELVTDPEMTEQLERDMKRIAEGEVGEDEVMDESREMLDRIFEILEEKEDEIGESLREGLKEDRTLGECPECGGALVVRRARRGSYFVGCDEYPDCTNTYPLPNRGKAVLTDDVCEEHGLREVRMLDGRNTFVHGCPICKVEEAEDEDEEVIGDCPDCGESDGGELAIKRTRSGGRLVGCTRYPDCDYSLPLPRRGDIEVTDVLCDEHGLPELVVHSGSEPWELGCPICNYRNYKEEQQKKNGLQGIKGIGEATAEKLRDADIESVEDLREADPEELAEQIDNVSASRIREWQSA